DAKFARSGLNQPARAMFFVPLAQRVDYKTDYRRMVERLSHSIQGIMLVTDFPPGDLEPILRKTLAEADPNLTIVRVSTMQRQIDLLFNSIESGPSRASRNCSGFVALSLAAVGVYGVTAYMVAQQTNEIGIRIALAADRAQVIQLVLRRAFQRVAAGLVVGLPLAVGAA